MKLKKLERLIEEAIEGATFERGASLNQETKEITEKTKLYRETWIIQPLEDALDVVKKEIEKRKSYNRK